MSERPDYKAALSTLCPISFSIVGLSGDQIVAIAPGSGFFVAPFVALTAKHVIDELWNSLEAPWKIGKYPRQRTEAYYKVKAIQMPDANHPRVMAEWEIRSVTTCNHTDAAFLFLAPANDVATKLYLGTHLALSLEAPPPGSHIWAMGFPNTSINHEKGSAEYELLGCMTLVEGTVVESFPNGRGSWNFPQVRTNARFQPGMSGGPVISGSRLVGIISYGLVPEDAAPDGYVAELWPTLMSQVPVQLDPTYQFTPVIDLLRTGVMKAPGWEELLARASTATDELGRKTAVLGPAN